MEKNKNRLRRRRNGEDRPRRGVSHEGLPLDKRATRGRRTDAYQTSSEAGEKPRRQKKRNRQGGVYGDYHQFVKQFPCIFQLRTGHRCWGANTGHHVRSVGSGGKDYANEIPCCEALHTEIETLGNAEFQRRYGVDFEPIMFQIAEAWNRLNANVKCPSVPEPAGSILPDATRREIEGWRNSGAPEDTESW